MKVTYDTPEDFEVDDYLLSEGFFLNQDGTAATILPAFQPRMSGVCLLNVKQAQPWMNASAPVSEDELAMLVVGKISSHIQMPHKEITAPAHNSAGRAVLLKGCLVQCGSKQILCHEGPDVDMSPAKVKVCAITLFRSDYDEKTWNALISNPVKVTKQLLTLQGFANVLGRPWGRSFRKGDQPAPPHLCDQLQFHAEIYVERLDSMLARSGFNGIYVLPKDDQGKPAADYRIVWTAVAPKSLDTLTAGLAGIAGLVRTRKGHGVRVRREAYSLAWKTLHPDQPEPQEHRHQYQFRLQPFPHGTTKEDIVTWGNKTGWQVAPLRTQGAKQWVVGADCHPPTILTWNGHPLIAHEIQTKRHFEQIVVAGPRERKVHPRNSKNQFEEHRSETDSLSTEATTRSAKSSVFRIGDPFHDPWSAAAASASRMSTPAGTTPHERRVEQPSAIRPLQGPVASQFQLQEQRIQALEQAMGDFQNEQKEQQQRTQQHIQQLDRQLQQQQNETKQGFAEVANAHSQLTEAIRAQDGKMGAAFEELKSLFLANANKRKNPRPFHEGPDCDSPSEMEDDA